MIREVLTASLYVPYVLGGIESKIVNGAFLLFSKLGNSEQQNYMALSVAYHSRYRGEFWDTILRNKHHAHHPLFDTRMAYLKSRLLMFGVAGSILLNPLRSRRR